MTRSDLHYPLISVIVPVFNVEDYLVRCIDSILNQIYSNLEIILIDDGSPDKCGMICDYYAGRDGRITVIHSKNEGLSAARNKGIDISKGEYITFIDSDDYVSDGYILKMVQVAEKFQCDVVQCGFVKGESSVFPVISQSTKIEFFDNSSVFFNRKLKVTAWAKLFRSEVLKPFRFPEGKINEDEFFTYKVVYFSKKVVIMDISLYYYFQSPSSIMRGKNKKIRLDFIDAYQERLDLFLRNGEHDLVELTKKELAIRAMLYFIKFKKMNSETRNKLMSTFYSNTKGIIYSDVISIKERLILILFGISPNITSQIARAYLFLKGTTL